jgi:ceramide glucosyltransferase
MDLARLLLWMSVAGLATSTGFLCLAVFAAFQFRAKSKTKATEEAEFLPAVSLLKPLCGLEPNLEANLGSFFRQQYPRFEIVFGARDASDPALDVVSAMRRRFPDVRVKIVTTGEPQRANAKVCSLMKMYAASCFDYLIISDSDVHVKPSYVREVIRPLMNPEVGLVTCLYRGVPTGGLWSRLEALGMSVEMTSGVLVANLLEGMKFALGPTMAIRRDVVDRIGGFGILADYCADDYVLGAAVHAVGKDVVLSDHVIEHVVINRLLHDSLQHQVRWMKSTRFSRVWGHVGSVLTFSMPFGLLGMLAALWLHRPVLGLALLATAWLNRMVLSYAAGWAAVRDSRSFRFAWLYPLRDLMGFGFWCASFFGRVIQWRGESYSLEHGGLMVPCIADLSFALADDLEPLPSAVPADQLS